MTDKKLNILSVFDGISCGQIALERAGIKVNNYYASEIDKSAIKLTQHKYPNTIQLGDVEKWKGWKLPKIDLIMAGFLCQSFSRAGKQLNFKDPRGKLFFTLVDILNHYKPKYFLLENVKMKKEYSDVISKMVGTEFIAINSKLMSAQLRNRLYWTNIPNVSQPKDKNITLPQILEYGFTDRKKSRCLLRSVGGRIRNPKKIIKRFCTTGFITIVYKDRQTMEYITKNTKNGEVNIEIKDGDIRYLTRLELERLQTLPEGYTKILTEREAASGIGNGWTVDVISHILSNLKNG